MRRGDISRVLEALQRDRPRRGEERRERQRNMWYQRQQQQRSGGYEYRNQGASGSGGSGRHSTPPRYNQRREASGPPTYRSPRQQTMRSPIPSARAGSQPAASSHYARYDEAEQRRDASERSRDRSREHSSPAPPWTRPPIVRPNRQLKKKKPGIRARTLRPSEVRKRSNRVARRQGAVHRQDVKRCAGLPERLAAPSRAPVPIKQ